VVPTIAISVSQYRRYLEEFIGRINNSIYGRVDFPISTLFETLPLATTRASKDDLIARGDLVWDESGKAVTNSGNPMDVQFRDAKPGRIRVEVPRRIGFI